LNYGSQKTSLRFYNKQPMVEKCMPSIIMNAL